MEKIINEELITLLAAVPPDLAGLDSWLSRENLDTDVITQSTISYVNKYCTWEYNERIAVEELPLTKEKRHTLHSTYLCDELKILLKYGLKPNATYPDGCIASSIQFIDIDYISADAAAILMENGMNVNLDMDGEDFFSDWVEFDVIYDAIEQEDRHKYDCLVHLWLVLLGYGAKRRDGKDAIDLKPEFLPADGTGEIFDISKFKNHRNYYWGISYVPGNGEKWSLHIFDRNTGWEVARL